MMKRFIFLSFLVLAFSACSPFIMVTAQRDQSYELNRDYPIFLHLKDDVSISEKNTYNLISTALSKSQFKVANSLEDAKLVLTFSSSMTQRVMRTFDPNPWYYGPWPHYYHPYWYTPFPQVYVTEDLVIKLRLFDAQSFKAGKLIPLWEGAAYGDTGDVESKLQESLDFLVGKIGTDFSGRVKVGR